MPNLFLLVFLVSCLLCVGGNTTPWALDRQTRRHSPLSGACDRRRNVGEAGKLFSLGQYLMEEITPMERKVCTRWEVQCPRPPQRNRLEQGRGQESTSVGVLLAFNSSYRLKHSKHPSLSLVPGKPFCGIYQECTDKHWNSELPAKTERGGLTPSETPRSRCAKSTVAGDPEIRRTTETTS